MPYSPAEPGPNFVPAPRPLLTDADFFNVTAMTATSDGTLYIGDVTDRGRRRILRVTPQGGVSTYAGLTDVPPAAPGFGIAWGPLPAPIDAGTDVTGLLATASGELYITINSVLAKIAPSAD